MSNRRPKATGWQRWVIRAIDALTALLRRIRHAHNNLRGQEDESNDDRNE